MREVFCLLVQRTGDAQNGRSTVQRGSVAIESVGRYLSRSLQAERLHMYYRAERHDVLRKDPRADAIMKSIEQ